VTNKPRTTEGSLRKRTPLGWLVEVRRRIELTIEYHGTRVLLLRMLTFPLRFTPLEPRVRFGRLPKGDPAKVLRAGAVAWYRRHWRPVTVVIPSYRDAERVQTLVASIRETTSEKRVRILVADDASGPEHVAALRAIPGIEVIEGDTNAGFAANVNRGVRAASASDDVVILNSDMIARPGWLASLQFTVRKKPGIAGAKLLYPDDLIQFGGTIRNLGAPEWFDHRHRFKRTDWGPANVVQPVLAVTGACMYIRREVIDAIGILDEAYPMAYEDVDFCLRAWQAGFPVTYCPAAELYHLESVTRGTEVGERERASQRHFWERWGEFFDARNVRNESGALRVIYVTEDTGVGGGHRVIFEHVNRLLDRGHEVELWSLDGPPDWFELRAPVRSFEEYDDLVEALAPIEAIKVATWWHTVDAVWEASVTRGIAVYFVQDIETSYYPDHPYARNEVLASYRSEFRYMTTSSWNRDQLRGLGLDASLIPPGIDLETFRPEANVERRPDVLLALGRSNPLKNFPLTLTAWQSLAEPRPELWLFGAEPRLAEGLPGVRYLGALTDAEINRLFSQATAFVQTSSHEGFCLPVLEAMAAGCPVICTDADGNMDFCVHEENCLMPGSSSREVAGAMRRLVADPALRDSLIRAGFETAAKYGWSPRVDDLERFFDDVATPRRIEPSTEAVPELRRTGVR
jgi:GT2 family glycosyltransferase/glycosyltransferase involved in cell wall biosynthesis